MCHKKAGRSKNGQKNRKNAQRKHHSSKKNISTLNHFDGFLWKMLGKRWRRGEKRTEKTDRLSGSWGWDAERAVFPMLGVGLKGLPRVVFLIIGFPQYCIPSRGTNMHLMAKENSSSQPPVKNVSSQVYTRVLRRCIGSNFGDVTRRISPNVCSFKFRSSLVSRKSMLAEPFQFGQMCRYLLILNNDNNGDDKYHI